MAEDVQNEFSQYHVSYTPNGAPVRVLVRLDDGSRGEKECIAGYLMFRSLDDDALPNDEVSEVSGYIIKNLPICRLEPTLDLLHRHIDLLKRPMVISGFVDASNRFRAWLSTSPPGDTEKELVGL